MTLPFAKYQSTGNDFIMIDNRNVQWHLTPKQVYYLCHRRFGIGADGLILIQNHKDADFEMVYYNSDGNLGSFCGNGSRSAVLFAKNIGAVTGSRLKFHAYDGLHEAEILNNGISVSMKPYKDYKKLNEKEFFLDTGSPHHVMFVEDVFHFPVKEKGKEIRDYDRYGPNGTNVNFVGILKDGIYVRTYERGVEEETLSCGTGVTASAICYLLNILNSQKGDVNVHTQGGSLKVSILPNQEIYLEGPAAEVFSGYINL